jgi:NADH:ubiquinone oxidoreductase subunit 5 (subunit L)/multisubunit Na+/H+ antiporter MnhA subunit
MNDLNKISREMGIKFVNEDMRLQRLATERLLEQRLLNKSFWEKWGTTIMMVIVFLVVAICMVIIFYQFGKIQDQQFANEQVQLETSKILLRVFGENFISETLNKTSSSWEANSGLIPA